MVRSLPNARMESQPKMLVLVADDYADLADMIAGMLMDILPCEAIAAKNGAEALELALARRPAACVFDVDMPKMSGIEVALAIRTGQPAAPPLLIAMTGGSHERARTSHAFDVVLQKPVDIQTLLDLLQPLCRTG